ncbi:MAG: PAS domain S-box protein [Candidatus Bathyarchaeota archaeon]|nr:PAS domain S-box protein [Candidatus Bathyarchaeota archaeon]
MSQSTEPKSIKVLHVDDDTSFLEISKQLLIDLNDNLKIETTESVDQALQLLSSKSFDVVVSDYEMPNKNGLDLLRILREQNNFVPFILFTGKGREEIAINAINLGADGYFNKYGNPETVYAELNHGIRLSHARHEAESKNKIEAQRRKVLLDYIPCIAVILEKQTRKIVSSNMIAQSQGGVPGKHCYNVFAGRDKPCDFCLAQKVWETNQTQTLEVEYKGKYYRGIWVPYSENFYVHYIFDITDIKIAQNKLKETLNSYRSLINGMTDTAWVIDFDGQVLEVNDAAVKLLGYSRTELLKVGLTGIDKKLTYQQIKELINKLTKNKKQIFETIHTTKYGKQIPVEISSTIITYFGREAILSIARDISERKKNDADIHSKEQRWVTTLKSIGDAVITTDQKGNIDFMNKIAEKLTGWTIKKAYGKPLSEVFRIINEESRLPLEDPVSKVLKQGYIVSLANHTILVNKKGAEIPIDDSAAPIFKEDGTITGIVLIFHDISERRSLERKVADSQKKYQSLFSEMSEGVCLHEVINNNQGQPVDYKILEINGAYESITGLSRKRVLGKLASEVYGTNPAPYLEIYAKVAKSGEMYQFETYFEPMQKHFLISVFSPAENQFATVFIDITETKKVQHELELIANERKILLEATQHLLNNKTFEEASKNIFEACKKITGATSGYVALLSEDGTENKVLFLDSGGLRCTVEKNLPMPIRGLRETAYRLGRAVYENKFVKSEWVKLMPEGHVTLSNVMFSPIIVNNKVEGLIGLANKASDFTEKDASMTTSFGNYAAIALKNSWNVKALEEREQQVKKTLEQLRATNLKLTNLTEKMKVIGSLTRHDVKNKLFVAKNNTFLLKKKLKNNPELEKYLDGINFAVDQADELFEFGRLYEKVGAEEPKKIDVALSFDKAVSLFPNSSLRIHNGCQGLTLTADSMLDQLFYNLIDNSLKHGKTVTQIKLYYSINTDTLKIFYEDDGLGVVSENKEKIFTGFTTGGNGLGLMLVKKMVETYGWSIKEIGVPGEGLRIEINIPKNIEKTNFVKPI